MQYVLLLRKNDHLRLADISLKQDLLHKMSLDRNEATKKTTFLPSDFIMKFTSEDLEKRGPFPNVFVVWCPDPFLKLILVSHTGSKVIFLLQKTK